LTPGFTLCPLHGALPISALTADLLPYSFSWSVNSLESKMTPSRSSTATWLEDREIDGADPSSDRYMARARRERVKNRSAPPPRRSEEHTSELQSLAYLVC